MSGTGPDRTIGRVQSLGAQAQFLGSGLRGDLKTATPGAEPARRDAQRGGDSDIRICYLTIQIICDTSAHTRQSGFRLSGSPTAIIQSIRRAISDMRLFVAETSVLSTRRALAH